MLDYSFGFPRSISFSPCFRRLQQGFLGSGRVMARSAKRETGTTGEEQSGTPTRPSGHRRRAFLSVAALPSTWWTTPCRLLVCAAEAHCRVGRVPAEHRIAHQPFGGWPVITSLAVAVQARRLMPPRLGRQRSQAVIKLNRVRDPCMHGLISTTVRFKLKPNHNFKSELNRVLVVRF